MKITDELYKFYEKNNFKIIFSRGYSANNKETDIVKKYKAAKVPVCKWRDQKETKTKAETEKWLDANGWIAVVLPADIIALDVDASSAEKLELKFNMVKEICSLSPYALHHSKNGYHFIFKSLKVESASSRVMTKAGIVLTYRPGAKTNIIVAPSDGRQWIKCVDNDKLASLPDLLHPLDFKNQIEVRNALAMQLGYCYRAKILSGNDHLDFAFMHYLVVDCGNDWPTVAEIFQEIYCLEYDEAKTKLNFERVQNKDQKCKTIDTLLKVLHTKELDNIIELINCYGAAAGSTKFVESSSEPDKKTSIREIAFKFAEEYATSRKIFSCKKTLYQRGLDFVYTPLEIEYMMQDFTDRLGYKYYSARLVEEMVTFVKQKKVTRLPVVSKNVLMRDGLVFELDKFQTRKPIESDIFYNKSNGAYNPEAKCPRFMQFLKEIFPENSEVYIDFFKQFIGSIFLPDLRFEIALIFRGEGANGKSVFMDVIERIVGEHNVTHIPLSKLKDEKYSAFLINSLLNMHAEIESRIVVDDDIIKTLVSGETTMARNPYEKAIQFKPKCKFIYASNNAVTSLDKSAGYERRILFIDFLANFDAMPEKKDIHLRQKLFAEIDGIFTWAIDGAKEVLKNGKLIIPEILFSKSKNEHKINNPIHEFASEHLVWSMQPDARTTIGDIYREFRLFCDMNGYKVSNKKNFAQNIRRVVPDFLHLQSKFSGGKRGFCSVWLLPTYYDKRSGDVRSGEDQRVINESCEKYVTEMPYKDYLNWRKSLKESE